MTFQLNKPLLVNHHIRNLIKKVISHIKLLILITIPVSIGIFQGSMVYGTIALTASKPDYFGRSMNYFPNYFFNLDGIPAMLLGGIIYLGVILLIKCKIGPKNNSNISQNIHRFFDFAMIIGLLFFPIDQILIYFRIMPPNLATIFLGPAIIGALLVFIQLFNGTLFRNGRLSHILLYVLMLFSFAIGCILPSDSSAISNLYSVQNLLFAILPVLLLSAIMIGKRWGNFVNAKKSFGGRSE
jgi:hypothetical protein